jgi:bis(5'-nucleosyl)-tetraphosphatase (symmetrical)
VPSGTGTGTETGTASMATWAIGDIHGCWLTLQRLLERIEWNAVRDELWLVGDLVNRGPSSLEVLRWAVEHDEHVTAVLGNHDLHLLARACGMAPSKKSDILDEVLAAPDREDLLEWLRNRPLMHQFGRFVLVHAGLAPEWNVELAHGYVDAIRMDCQGDDSHSLLTAIHARQKIPWHVDLPREDQLAAAAVAMTRIRMVGPDGRGVLDYTGPPGSAPDGCRPWFASSAVLRQGYNVIFGHWAMLGLYRTRGVMCLDSGCVYGGRLTALRLDDGQVVQQDLLDEVEA